MLPGHYDANGTYVYDAAPTAPSDNPMGHDAQGNHNWTNDPALSYQNRTGIGRYINEESSPENVAQVKWNNTARALGDAYGDMKNGRYYDPNKAAWTIGQGIEGSQWVGYRDNALNLQANGAHAAGALGGLRSSAMGQGLSAESQYQADQLAARRSMASLANSGQRGGYDPSVARSAISAGSSAAGSIGDQGRLAALNEQRQAQGMFANSALAREQANRRFLTGKQGVAQGWSQTGLGDKYGQAGAAQNYETQLMRQEQAAYDNRLKQAAAFGGINYKGGTDPLTSFIGGVLS